MHHCLRFLSFGHVVNFLSTPQFQVFYSRSHLIRYYRAYAKLGYHNRHVSAFPEMDKLNMLDSKSQEIEKILVDSVDITSIHRHIESLKFYAKNSARKVMRVNRSDGRPSTSRSEEKQVFHRSHFSSQLGASFGTIERSHSDSLDSLRDLKVSTSGVGASSVFPGISSLAKLLKSAGLGAGGEDRVRGQLCRRLSRAFSCLYYPLMFKLSCLLSPPPSNGVVVSFKSYLRTRARPPPLIIIVILCSALSLVSVSLVILGLILFQLPRCYVVVHSLAQGSMVVRQRLRIFMLGCFLIIASTISFLVLTFLWI